LTTLTRCAILRPMKRTFVTLILLISILSRVAIAANKEDTETLGLKNGRFWNALPDEISYRRLFLVGILDGWELRGNTEDEVSGKVLGAMSKCGASFRYEELAEMITQAYKEPENRSLPIGWVMIADFAIQCGRTTGDVVFPALRKHLADISSKTVSGDAISPIDVILSASAKQH
jgi:hypothetical protein